MSNPVLKITMVGPSRVGKTSLLAAMYKELERELSEFGATFVPDVRTQPAITARRNELQLLGAGTNLDVSKIVSISGTQDKREYDFTLSVKLENSRTEKLEVQFIDMPGGWYQGDQRGDQRADTELAKSNVSIWVVDATALMEQPQEETNIGKYHELINDPETIYNAYQRALAGRHTDHFIVMCLVRAESYVRKNQQNEMYQKLNQSYAPFLRQLKQQTPSLGTVEACYVETVGSVVFHTFRKEKEVPYATFMKLQNKTYSPSGCAKPLRSVIVHALQQSLLAKIIETNKTIEDIDITIEKVREADTLWNNFWGILGFETDLEKYIRDHTNLEIKHDELVNIGQGLRHVLEEIMRNKKTSDYFTFNL
ncbi:MAG: 50S ribosome-binding GTPase [Planctomycetaceae bacterium]|jgi:GTPase SAR1 family protein|nr:50S ribosome-binding GTPase [Planctomycetaceae bacterium]